MSHAPGTRPSPLKQRAAVSPLSTTERVRRSVRLTLLTIAALWGITVAQAQADPILNCPSAATTLQVPQQTLTFYKDSRSHPVSMASCETLEVWFNGTGNSMYGSAFLVELISTTGIVLSRNSAPCYGPCTIRVPHPGHGAWTGTRGPAGLVGNVRVTLSGGLSTPNPTYTLTITRTPRPGYNEGGLGVADAPLLSSVPARIRGSFVKEEVGQYFKIRLTGNGTLRVSGTGYSSWAYGATLVVHVLAADGTFSKEILRQVIGTGSSFNSTTFTSTSSAPAEFYVRIYVYNYWPNQYVYGYWLNDLDMTIEGQAAQGPFLKASLDGGPLTPAAGVLMPTTAHVPLGAAVTFALVDATGGPVNASFEIGTPTLSSTLGPNSLFPDNVVFSYRLHDPDKAIYQAAHKGQVTITVRPADTQYAPTTFTVTVEDPVRLGAPPNGDLDIVLVTFADRFGIPPQFLKAHVSKESEFDPLAYRYEPIGNIGDLKTISRGRNYRRNTVPYRDYRFATWNDELDPDLPEGAFVDADDRDVAAHGGKGGLEIACDLKGRNGRTLTGADLPVVVTEVFRCNANQRWPQVNGRDRMLTVYVDSFTAQLSLAGTFGYMQVMYIDAIDTLKWTGASDNGRKNPSLLFDTDQNLARGAGSLPLGCKKVARSYHAAHGAPALAPTDAYDDPAALLEAFKRVWARYNLDRRYPAEVANRVPTYAVVGRPIF